MEPLAGCFCVRRFLMKIIILDGHMVNPGDRHQPLVRKRAGRWFTQNRYFLALLKSAIAGVLLPGCVPTPPNLGLR